MGSPTPPPTVSTDRLRRDPRYAAEIEVHVAFKGRSLVTLTREISRSGLFFFADPAPQIGETLSLVLHPEHRVAIPIHATVRYVLPGVGAGVEVGGGDAEKFRAFVEDQSSAQKAWQIIGGFVRSAIDSNDLPAMQFEQKEMIDVGESCEAYRLLFARHPPVPLNRTTLGAFAAALPHANSVLSGVSLEPVGLKLNSRDRLRNMYLGVLKHEPGWVAVLPPSRERDRFSFYSLSGREQILIREGDRDVFPYFDEHDLMRIQGDAVSRVHSDKELPAIPLDRAGFISARYATAIRANDSGEFREEIVHDLRDTLPPIPREDKKTPPRPAQLPSLSRWTRFEGRVEEVVRGLFNLFEAETRAYSVGGVERLVRLLRNLTVVVRTGDEEPEEGILLHDGKRVCVLVGMKSRESMRIRPLTAADEIRIPCW